MLDSLTLSCIDMKEKYLPGLGYTVLCRLTVVSLNFVILIVVALQQDHLEKR